MGSDQPRFPFLRVDSSAARADQLAVQLIELGSDGVELRDDSTLVRGPGVGRVTLVASFARRDDAASALRVLAADATLSCELGEIVGDAWRDAYRDFFSPFRLTPSLWVVPPWEREPPGEPAERLWMEPGRAFGTGLHPTTALVAEQLERRRETFAGQSVLDVGTGSGVLAFAALLLGAAAARAIDNDAEAVSVAKSNALLNHFGDRVCIDTAPLDTVAGCFPMVVANIRPRTLIALAPAIVSRVAHDGLLVLSGILDSEQHAVRTVLVSAARGLGVALSCVDAPSQLDPTGQGEAWVALVYGRSD